MLTKKISLIMVNDIDDDVNIGDNWGGVIINHLHNSHFNQIYLFP